MVKKIITELRIDEISGVDRPAQPGATVAIMKRAAAPETPPKENDTMDRAALLALIAKFMSAPVQTDLDSIKKAVGETPALADMKPVTDNLAMPKTDPAVEVLTKRLERMDKIAKMSPEVKTYFEGRPEAEQETFLAKSVEEQADIVQKATATDPVVYTCLDGTEIRKSDGSTVLTLAKRADAADRGLAAERANRLDVDLTKRANEELGNLTGDENVRKAMLRAVDGIADENVRKAALESLKAADTIAKGDFQRQGNPGLDPLSKSGSAEAQLEALAKAYQVAKNVDFVAAYDEVLKTPDGRKLYQQTLAQ